MSSRTSDVKSGSSSPLCSKRIHLSLLFCPNVSPSWTNHRPNLTFFNTFHRSVYSHVIIRLSLLSIPPSPHRICLRSPAGRKWQKEAEIAISWDVAWSSQDFKPKSAPSLVARVRSPWSSPGGLTALCVCSLTEQRNTGARAGSKRLTASGFSRRDEGGEGYTVKAIDSKREKYPVRGGAERWTLSPPLSGTGPCSRGPAALTSRRRGHPGDQIPVTGDQIPRARGDFVATLYVIKIWISKNNTITLFCVRVCVCVCVRVCACACVCILLQLCML